MPHKRECPGHADDTNGPMGVTTYCDGSCQNHKKLKKESQLKGKTISGVEFDRGTSTRTEKRFASVERITFTDGTVLRLTVSEVGETNGDYAVEGTFY